MHIEGNKDAALARLKRVQGQVGGLIRMIEEDRYCMDVLNQTLAVKRALRAIEKLVIEDHAEFCVEEAIEAGDPADQRAKFREMIDLLDKARE